MVDGIRTTRVARTLVDLAGVLPPARTERAVDNCLSMGVVTIANLRMMTDELGRQGRAGIALMRQLVEDRADGTSPQPANWRLGSWISSGAANLPSPVRQLQVGGEDAWVGRADFAYPEARLLVELDSRRHHSSKLDLEADRARDNLLVVAGWRVVRVTWGQLHGDPRSVVALISPGSAAAYVFW